MNISWRNIYNTILFTCDKAWENCLMYFPIHCNSEEDDAFVSAPELKAQVHYCDHALSVVRPSLTLHIFDFSSETTEQNSTKLYRKRELNILYQVCVFRVDPKNKMAALASDWVRHFRLLLWNRWTEFNETWQEARSQHPLPSVCFSDWTKNKMAVLASDWLRQIRLLLWKRWTEFNETWLEARSQHHLPSLCFSGRSEKQDGCPGLWFADIFLTSPLKPLNGIQRNLTGSKIATSSTKFVFCGLISKQKCLPWPIPQKGGTLYSGTRYVALWASCWVTLSRKRNACSCILNTKNISFCFHCEIKGNL